jgi:polysaccharide pyruvyl transferase WcaK-like protein
VRFGLISTLDTNIGDDLIRAGIVRVLDEAFPQPHEYVTINKHRPLTVLRTQLPADVAGVFPSRYERRLSRISGRLLTRILPTRFDDVDAIIQCGTPVFWPHCAKCEWREAIWEGVVSRKRGTTPTLNLAAGSSYPERDQPESGLDPEDAQYLREVLTSCVVTTVRDPLAARLASSLGSNAEVIPCSAFLAAPENSIAHTDDGPILVNYMVGGGHFDWNQGIDLQHWEQTMIELVARLKARHRVQFLCHSDAEAGLARQIDPAADVLLPRGVDEYFELTAGARGALCNRLHASVALAGAGIPSIAVGTDTRMAMVATLGLTTHFVNDVSTSSLEREIEGLLATRERERERLLDLRSATTRRYVDVVREALRP